MSVHVLAPRARGGISALPEDRPGEPGERRSRRAERTQFRSCIRALGLSGDDFDEKVIELLVDRGSATPGEVFWELADVALHEAKERGDHLAMSQVLGTMARALHEQGQHHLPLQREAHRALLRSLTAEGATKVELDAVCGCSICKPTWGQRWLVSDALEQLPVPHERCENGFCECGWSRGWSADPHHD